MLKYAHSEFLGLIAIILPLLFIWLLDFWKRKKLQEKLGNRQLIFRMSPWYSLTKQIVKFTLVLLSLVFLIFALVNPQIGTKTEKQKHKGVDIVIAIDLSNSMNCQDLKPNRLDRSKQFVSKLIDKLENDRVALVIFAGDAYLQLPLTTDYTAAKMYLSEIQTGTIPVQGTHIGNALDRCASSFVTGDDDISKTILLISDGEDNEEQAIEKAKLLSQKKIQIHTVGVGTPDGAPVPSSIPGEYKKDESGNEVISKMNPETLKEIASITGGSYFNFTGSATEINSMINTIARIDKKEFNEVVFTSFKSLYQYLLLIAFTILLFETLLFNRKGTWLSRFINRKKNLQ